MLAWLPAGNAKNNEVIAHVYLQIYERRGSIFRGFDHGRSQQGQNGSCVPQFLSRACDEHCKANLRAATGRCFLNKDTICENIFRSCIRRKQARLVPRRLSRESVHWLIPWGQPSYRTVRNKCQPTDFFFRFTKGWNSCTSLKKRACLVRVPKD